MSVLRGAPAAGLEEELAQVAAELAGLDAARGVLLAERDAHIRVLHAKGVSLRRLAVLSGLSHNGVADIVRREGARKGVKR